MSDAHVAEMLGGDRQIPHRRNPQTQEWEIDYAALERRIADEQMTPGERAQRDEQAELIASAHRARRNARARLEGLRDAIDDELANRRRHAPAWPGALARHDRTVEHLVVNTTGAATVNQPFDVGHIPWVAGLAEAWTRSAMPITAATAIVEVTTLDGLPTIPAVTTVPEAGPQSGEKQLAHSKAFTVGAATTTPIDSTLHLNWSMQLEGLAPSAAELGRAMQQAAVADEADRQVGAAIVADGTAVADLDAALAAFDTGRHLPSVLIVGPGALGATLGTYRPADLQALGISTVLAHVDKAVLAAAGAVTGWLMPLQAMAVEPSVLGTGRAWAMWGAVAVDPTGVAVIG